MKLNSFSLIALLSACFAAPVAHATVAALCVAPEGAGGCHATIQSAIDAATSGTVIDVYPGQYHEVAAGRSVVGLKGAHQFGLFIDKNDLTIRGVEASGAPVARWSNVAARITTDATNAFGPSAIFVQGDGVTLSGLGIGANESGLNKTIEVIGDRFALVATDVSDVNGSIYINDYRYDAAALTSHVESFRIEGNNFRDGVSVDIANGAGVSGSPSGRAISGNTFINSKAFPSIAFNGAGTGVRWFEHPVGGAIVDGNVFINTFTSKDANALARAGHIAVRGIVDRTQFDWASMLSSNVFNQAYATGPQVHINASFPFVEPRQFALAMPDWKACGEATCAFNAMRIGGSLAGEATIALAGDVTVGRSGTLSPRLFDPY